MGSVRDTGASEKLKNLFERIREDAPELLRQVGQEVADTVAQRAPSPQEETETIMYGEGNPYGIQNDATPTARSDGDGRIRFMPKGFLQEFIPYSHGPVNELYYGIGQKSELEELTRYEYQNQGRSATEATDPEVETTYGTEEGFIFAWEYGGVFTIVPRAEGKNGLPYPLRPSLSDRLFEMTKRIPRKQMYGGVNLQEHVEQTLEPAIKKLARSAK